MWTKRDCCKLSDLSDARKKLDTSPLIHQWGNNSKFFILLDKALPKAAFWTSNIEKITRIAEP